MLEIYDCTLREGEQAAGASFSLANRLKLFKKLDEFGVDYIEVGWPIASKETLEAFKLCEKIRKNAKIVAFGSTSIAKNPKEDKNLGTILESGAEYACIFGKSWLEHVEKQLKITGEENLKRISNSVGFLKEKGLNVFYDAEHYFDAYKSDKNYAIETLVSAAKAGAERIILCDTNGGILPEEARKIVSETKSKLLEERVDTELGIHFHNDSGLALANSLACLSDIIQIQGTINGIGERVGNLNFSEFLPVYMKKMNCNLDLDLKKLKEINEAAYKLSRVNIPDSRAFVGDMAFAHKGGIHIDATSKGASYEHANPEDFGNKRVILLNTLGGRGGVISIAREFGYQLDKKDPDVKHRIENLFNELRESETKGYNLSALKAEQFLFIEKYFGRLENFFEIEKWEINTGVDNGREKSKFYVKARIHRESAEDSLTINGGPVDAAYKTISRLLSKKYPEIKDLQLTDFHVSIARGKEEESSVRTLISFQDQERFETVGVDKNILESSIEALTKGFRYYLNIRRKRI